MASQSLLASKTVLVVQFVNEYTYKSVWPGKARIHVEIQRGDWGRTPPPEKSQKIGFLSNTGLNPLKITKLPSKHSMLGHHRHASETPLSSETSYNAVSLAADDSTLIVLFGSTHQKKALQSCPILTKLSESPYVTRQREQNLSKASNQISLPQGMKN